MASVTLQTVLRSIGANVARLRVKRDLTQEQLAERAEVDLRHLIRIQRGEVSVSLALLVRLAEELEVTPVQLLKTATAPRPRAGRPAKRSQLAGRR